MGILQLPIREHSRGQRGPFVRMRVLLINPPWIIRSRTNVWRSVASVMPPWGWRGWPPSLERDGHKCHPGRARRAAGRGRRRAVDAGPGSIRPGRD